MKTKTMCRCEGCSNEALHYDANNLGFCILHQDYQITLQAQKITVKNRA
jgi:hypothetical protein